MFHSNLFVNEPLLQNAAETPAKPQRVATLDVLRGIVVWTMIHYGLACHFDDIGGWYCNQYYYLNVHDLVMPAFYVCIGFSMELTLGRLRDREQSYMAVVKKQLARSRSLFCLGVIYHGFYGWSTYDDLMDAKWHYVTKWFGDDNARLYQTLTIIAVAQVVALPAITRPLWVRIGYAVLLATVWMVCQRYFWFEYMWDGWVAGVSPQEPKYVDGGSLGTMNHAVMILIGTVCNDFLRYVETRAEEGGRRATAIAGMVVAAAVMMGTSVLLTLVPQTESSICYDGVTRLPAACDEDGVLSIPFVEPSSTVISMWSFSQLAGTMPYTLFTCGLTLVLFLVAYYIAEVGKWRVTYLTDLSQHSLVMYMYVPYMNDFIRNLFPDDSPLWWIIPSAIIGAFINYKVLYWFKAQNINVRL